MIQPLAICRFRHPVFSFVLPAVLIAASASGEVKRRAVDPSRFETTVLATDLNRPMELAIANDGSVFFIELDGKLKLLDSRSGKTSLVAELTVTTEQENGPLGVIVKPG